MKRIGFGVAAALLLAAMTAGCATRVERHFGEAYHENMRRMVAYPEAGRMNTAPVLGLDSATAELVFHTYKESQKQPEAADRPSIINIGR